MSHDGKKFVVEEVIRHETGPSVVMNCSSYSNDKCSFLVAGQESHCQLYQVKSVLIDETPVEDVSPQNDVKNRKKPTKQKRDKNENNKKLEFVISPSESIQTDFYEDEPLQRVVRISKDGKLMATGNFPV